MFIKKLTLLTTSIFAGLTTALFGGKVANDADFDFKPAFADTLADGEFRSYVISEPSNHDYEIGMNEDYARSVTATGEELFVEFDLDSSVVGNLYYSTSNINLYSNKAFSFVVGYHENIFDELINIAKKLDFRRFVVPAISFDNQVIANFYVNNNTVNLIADTNVVKGFDYVADGGSDKLFRFDISSKVNHVAKLGTLAYGEYEVYEGPENQSELYTYQFEKGIVRKRFTHHNGATSISVPKGHLLYFGLISEEQDILYTNDTVLLPYDVTYLNYLTGEFSLGNSYDLEYYGLYEREMYLDTITFGVYHEGEKISYRSHLMTTEQRTLFEDTLSTTEAKQAAIGQAFTFAPRPKNDDEVDPHGSGGLIYSNYIPYKPYDITKSSFIYIESLGFRAYGDNQTRAAYVPGDYNISNTWLVANNAWYNISIPQDSEGRSLIKAKYYADKCVGKATYKMYGLNMNSTRVVTYETPWYQKLVGGLFYGLSYPIISIVTDRYISNSFSAGNNIQRFYFNMYEKSQNQKLVNIKKIQFQYQEGHQKVKVTDSSTDTEIYPDYYDGGEINHKTVDVSDSSTYEESFSVPFLFQKLGNLTVEQDDVFVSIEDDPRKLGDDYYSYYYQNVYNDQTYSDFINYWTPISVWYETVTGTTERLTTKVDGTYLAEDEEGILRIFSFETGEPTDISVKDFYTTPTDGYATHIEDGEESDATKEDKATKEWFDKIGSMFGNIGEDFNTLKTVLIVAVTVIVGMVFLAITIRIFRFAFKKRDRRDQQ